MNAAATVALTVTGLAAVYGVALRTVSRAAASWTAVAMLFATSLWPTLLSGSPTGLVAAASFALASAALALGWLAKSRPPRGIAMALWLAALALPLVSEGYRPEPDFSAVSDALFSSPRGLFFWSPVLWAGVVGLIRLATRDRVRGAWAGAGLIAAALVAAGPGPLGPVAGGRFHAALPLLGIGLAHALAWAREIVEDRPAVPLAMGAAALTVWNFLFMEQYRTDRIPRDLPVRFADVSETNAAILAKAVGSPAAWPANWLFAWRHSVTPAKYDVVVGLGPWAPGFVPIDDTRVDPGLLAEGWKGRARCGEGPCRRVAGSARMLMPLGAGVPRPTSVRVTGPASITIAVNGARPALHAIGATAMDVPLPGPAWREGVNVIAFRSAPPEGAAVLGLSFGTTGER
jgi:hypothetical protein